MAARKTTEVPVNTRKWQEFKDGKTRVNVNTATVEELLTLPSVGSCIAQMFIQTREKNGPFKSMADVALVSGMGKKNLHRIQDCIRFE